MKKIIYLFPMLLLILSATGCMNQIPQLSGGGNNSSNTDNSKILGEWLVTFESYEDPYQSNAVVTNTAQTITDTDVYTLKFKQDNSVDIISYSNGVVYNYATNYYFRYYINESNQSIDLIAPVDYTVSVSHYPYGSGFATNQDAVTNIRIYTNYTYDYTVTDTDMEYVAGNTVLTQTNDYITETTTMVTIFSYYYNFDAAGQMHWLTKDTIAELPPDLTNTRSFTAYTITTMDGTNGTHSGNMFINFNLDRYAKVNFVKIR